MSVAFIGDPKTFNPVLSNESSSEEAIYLLFSGLVKLNIKTLKPEPDLAKYWVVSKDGKSITFFLKKVFWSDGKPFTADDVLFTFNDIYYNKNIPSSIGDSLKVDNLPIKLYEVKFVLPKPFPAVFTALSAPILPKHVLYKYVKENKFNNVWNVSDYKSIVGTGPYVIKKYAKTQYIIYERNSYYYERDEIGQKIPYIKEIIAYIYQDNDTAYFNFLNGSFSYTSLSPSWLYFFEREKNRKNFTIYDLGPTATITFLSFNENKNADIPSYKLRWFRDVNFRRAISYAIDRNSIVNLVYNGLAKPLYTPITPANMYYFDPNYYETFEYSPSKALSILEKDGFYLKNKKLYDKEGNRVKFVLITNSNSEERIKMGSIIKEDLQKIGIDVIFQPLDFNSLVERISQKPYSWECVLLGLTGSIDPYFGSNVWLSSGQLHIWNPSQKYPSTKWEKEVDDLFLKASYETNFRKRVNLYKKAFKIITYEEPMIFLVVPKSLESSYNYLQNFFPTVWGNYKSLYMFYNQ